VGAGERGKVGECLRGCKSVKVCVRGGRLGDIEHGKQWEETGRPIDRQTDKFKPHTQANTHRHTDRRTGRNTENHEDWPTRLVDPTLCLTTRAIPQSTARF
jgi:hypothetical protein